MTISMFEDVAPWNAAKCAQALVKVTALTLTTIINLITLKGAAAIKLYGGAQEGYRTMLGMYGGGGVTSFQYFYISNSSI